ncbi:MAG: hypothetical protein K0S12_238 [Bacteroidetes bacterium]|jgi:hypothetical protein|nr:hypothetical protein [Bacteroidota bacterium]
MNYNIIAYSIYIPVTIALSVWIAKSLHRNTKAFLVEKFQHNDALATATNNLIQTGFYLIAFGFSFMRMHIKNFAHSVKGGVIWAQITNTQEAIEQLASKLGTFTLVLGLLLFLNFFIMLMIQKPKKQQGNFVISNENL